MYEGVRPYRKHERYYGTCVHCGRENEKRLMASLYIKENGYSPLRMLCNVCHRCLPKILDEWEVSMPE